MRKMKIKDCKPGDRFKFYDDEYVLIDREALKEALDAGQYIAWVPSEDRIARFDAAGKTEVVNLNRVALLSCDLPVGTVYRFVNGGVTYIKLSDTHYWNTVLQCRFEFSYNDANREVEII
jgi:hypothetical protein